MHIPPPVIVAAALLAQRKLAGSADTAPPAARVAGAVVGAVSLTLMGGTVAQFALAETTVDPARPGAASALVTTGPNRLSRNPIYLGFAGLLVAHALWRGSAAAAVPVVGFVAGLTPQIRREEEALLDRFGRAYAAYVRRVPRWILPMKS